MSGKAPGLQTAAATLVNPIDAHVGVRLRSLRQQSNMDAEAVVEAFVADPVATGLTLTQARLTAYEAGVERVGAADLYIFCRILGVKPAEFFEGL